MFSHLLQGTVLIAITVAIHTGVMGWIIWWLQHKPAVARSFWVEYTLLARIAVLCVFAHLSEIAVWAVFYVWQDVMPDLEIAAYFSAVTYATIGYGDIVPPAQWRLVASMEGLTGILMCAWSGGFIFAVVMRLWEKRAAAR
jgi:voltage-gated potassium channel Kch